jgi:hypothetical protein
MKSFYLLLVGLLIGFGGTQKMQGQESLASGFGLYVFPSNDQNREQQDADEMACYRWAKEQSGVDPMNPPDVVAADVDTSVDGSAVRGAAGGAAALEQLLEESAAGEAKLPTTKGSRRPITLRQRKHRKN